MSQNANRKIIDSPEKNSTVYLSKEKRGAFAVILLSGVVIATFVVYYLILGQESRKKNSLQLIVAVSVIYIIYICNDY